MLKCNENNMQKVNRYIYIYIYSNIYSTAAPVFNLPDLSCRSSNFEPLSSTFDILSCIIPMTPLISDFTFAIPSFTVGCGFMWWKPSGAANLYKLKNID